MTIFVLLKIYGVFQISVWQPLLTNSHQPLSCFSNFGHDVDPQLLGHARLHGRAGRALGHLGQHQLQAVHHHRTECRGVQQHRRVLWSEGWCWECSDCHSLLFYCSRKHKEDHTSAHFSILFLIFIIELLILFLFLIVLLQFFGGRSYFDQGQFPLGTNHYLQRLVLTTSGQI